MYYYFPWLAKGVTYSKYIPTILVERQKLLKYEINQMIKNLYILSLINNLSKIQLAICREGAGVCYEKIAEMLCL
jgi:hypothetical protein